MVILPVSISKFARVDEVLYSALVILVFLGSKSHNFFSPYQEKITQRFPRLSISSPRDYLTLHRFGYKLEDIEGDEELASALDEYKDRIGEIRTNSRNERFYIDAFMNRDDLTSRLKNIPDDMLFISGNRNAYVVNLDSMYAQCNKTKVSQFGTISLSLSPPLPPPHKSHALFVGALRLLLLSSIFPVFFFSHSGLVG